MIPDTSLDFHSPDSVCPDHKHEDRRQEARIALYESTVISLDNQTQTMPARLTDMSLCGFQIQHQNQIPISQTFTLCHSEERTLVRPVWEHHVNGSVTMGLVREEVYLINRLRDGHVEAIVQLMSPYLRTLRKFARSIVHSQEDTQDVLQEVMVKVLMRTGQFHPGRSFQAWLMQITRNEALKLLRGFRGHVYVSIPADDDECNTLHLYSARDSPADQLERREIEFALHDAVAALETKYRQVYLLRHWLQLDMPEVARHLGISVDNANTRLHRAHMGIRARLGAVFGPAINGSAGHRKDD